MTNERQHPDSKAETDESVSTTYRELARERAPDHLNEKVLLQATKQAARPRYSRSIIWTRPLAWAATIALCLAITLEVTRVPTPEAVVTSEAVVTPAPAASRKLDLPETDSLKAESPSSPAQQQPQQLSPDKSRLGRSFAKQAANEPRREARMRDAEYAAEADPEAKSSAIEEGFASGTVEFEVQDADMVQRADELARLQSDENLAAAPNEVGAFAVPASNVANSAVNECSDDVRSDPVTWLECIDDLEQAGETEAVLRQREDLKQTFPQFESP